MTDRCRKRLGIITADDEKLNRQFPTSAKGFKRRWQSLFPPVIADQQQDKSIRGYFQLLPGLRSSLQAEFRRELPEVDGVWNALSVRAGEMRLQLALDHF